MTEDLSLQTYDEFLRAAKMFSSRETARGKPMVAAVSSRHILLEGEVVPETIKPLRPAEKQRLVDIEMDRLKQERAELGQYRDDRFAKNLTHPSPERMIGPISRRQSSQTAERHRNNTEKLSEYRDVAHARAVEMQELGTACMREKRYDVAAQYYRDALAVKLPTSVADQDFLDPWKIAELNRDLSRAEEMVAMVARR